MNYLKKIVSLSFILLLISSTKPNQELEIKTLLNDKIELKIPKEFSLMGEDIIKIKYPANNRPTTVFSNTKTTTNIALNLTTHPADQNLIEQYKESFLNTFTKSIPTAEWKSNGVKEINGKKVGYLEFISPATDTKIYNLLFFTDVEKKLLLCNFNCIVEDTSQWLSVANEIFNSLKVK